MVFVVMERGWDLGDVSFINRVVMFLCLKLSRGDKLRDFIILVCSWIDVI